MNIRSITVFLDPGWPLERDTLGAAQALAEAAQERLHQAGYQVQTVRLATAPFPRWAPSLEEAALASVAQEVESAAAERGFAYVALGPALPELPASYAPIPKALSATQNVFFTGLLTTPGGGISLAAVQACARVIHQAAPLTADGFTNLRFAALANAPAGTPFFPAAYHAGGAMTFALALEAADLAVQAFEQASSLGEARQKLIAVMEQHAGAISAACERAAAAQGVAFSGLDFTLAPYPEPERSIGTALEALGSPGVGLHGTLAAAAFLADTLDRVSNPRTGFNGLMLPILEDATLAERAAQGLLTTQDLLLYSAVCGTGLDCIPLPGDASPEQLAAILLDVAALAQRLDKPLTARLLPVPGKAAGEPTGFDFSFFANSRVLKLQSDGLRHALAGTESFALRPRSPRRA